MAYFKHRSREKTIQCFWKQNSLLYRYLSINYEYSQIAWLFIELNYRKIDRMQKHNNGKVYYTELKSLDRFWCIDGGWFNNRYKTKVISKCCSPWLDVNFVFAYTKYRSVLLVMVLCISVHVFSPPSDYLQHALIFKLPFTAACASMWYRRSHYEFFHSKCFHYLY